MMPRRTLLVLVLLVVVVVASVVVYNYVRTQESSLVVEQSINITHFNPCRGERQQPVEFRHHLCKRQIGEGSIGDSRSLYNLHHPTFSRTWGHGNRAIELQAGPRRRRLYAVYLHIQGHCCQGDNILPMSCSFTTAGAQQETNHVSMARSIFLRNATSTLLYI
jgi:hypothetical protein